MRRSTPIHGGSRANLAALVLFGSAFGFVEAAVVYYLRYLGNVPLNYAATHYISYLNLGFIDFTSRSQTFLVTHRIGDVEVAREAATLLMLLGLSYVAGTNWRHRFAALMVSFACWDLTYYLFLRIIEGWPKSLFTKDVFFLIPVTWIGPVITPIVISLVLLFFGARLYLSD